MKTLPLLALLLAISVPAFAVDHDNNPPGAAGGPGTNWENPPGAVGDPGASPNRKNWCKQHPKKCHDHDNNPPGAAGGPGTNWENPPGPVGGPGASPNRK